MEGDPHQLVEGALIAAYATGASRVILYVHGEADLSAERLGRAVAQAEEAGLVGGRVLGRDFGCAVELRRGAGGFVLGEETALLESIEGRRAQPRTRPPFPVESGLWGKPTVINNVETLSAIPSIVGRGAAWFAGLGTPKSPGTKVFGLSGPIARPGVVEVRSGVTLQALIETIGGGLTGGRAGLGAVVGGPSGSIVPAALFDVVMEPRGRVSPGTGGIVAVPEGASVVEIVKTLLRFNAQESCGKCTPCREGTPRLLALIEEMERDAAADGHTARANELAEAIQLASLCGLGQAAPLALLRALETLPERNDGSLVIASPGAIAFELGPLTVRWYGILMATSIGVGFWLAHRQAQKEGLPADDILRVAQWAVIAGLIGARLYEVAFNWDYYGRYPWKIPAVWEGGLAMHGGIIVGFLTGVALAIHWRVPVLPSLDVVAPSMILGQAIGRWGNFFNEEAFGRPTDLPWKLYISPPHRPPEYANAEYFHPTFLYESLWNLAVFFALVGWLRPRYRDQPGALCFWYIGLYSVGRFAIESLRLDSFWVAGFRVAQLASVAGIAVAIIGLAWTRRRATTSPAGETLAS